MIGIDLDGTLLDCRNRQLALMRHAARVLGSPLDGEAYWQAKRSGASNRIALAGQGVVAPLIASMCALWEREIERWPWLDFDHPLPAAEEALQWAEQGGVALHLITARACPAQLRMQIERLGWSRRFASINVVSPRDVQRAKAEVLRMRGCICMVGDTEADASAAALAGISAHSVSSGMRDAATLRAGGSLSIHVNVLLALRAAIVPPEL